MNGPWVDYQQTGTEQRPKGDRTPPPGHRYDPARDSFVRDVAPVSEVAPEGAGPWAQYGPNLQPGYNPFPQADYGDNGDQVTTTEQTRAPIMDRPFWNTGDFFNSVGGGLQKGISGLLGLPGEMGNWSQEWDRFSDSLMGEGAHPDNPQARPQDFQPHPISDWWAREVPDTAQALDYVTEGKGPHQPATIMGGYGDTLGQFLPGLALGPEAFIPTIAGAAASETAGLAAQAAGAPGIVEQGVRGAAGFAGGFAGARPSGASAQMLANAARDLTPAQIQAVEALMGQAQQRGVQLTVAEAVQQVTGGATNMGRIQRVVEGTEAGQQRIAPVMAQRPQAVQGAVEQSLDRIAPRADSPGMVAQRGQAAAEGVLSNARRRVNDSAQPLYDQLPGQTIDPGQMQWLQADPSYAAAVARIRSDPIQGPRWAGVDDADMAFHNAVVKRMGQDADLASRPEMNPGADRDTAGLISQSEDIAQTIGRQASPEYDRALETVSTGHRAFVDPLKASPIGRMSGDKQAPTIQAQTGALFPAAPAEGAATETGLAMRLLREQDPALPADLTRQSLANTFNESSQALSTGPNPWGGAKFAANVAGNPEQRLNLMSALDEVGAADDVEGLLEVLAATGKREAPGSQTAFNAADLEALRGTSAVTDTLKSGWAPWRSLGNWLEATNARNNASALAEALMADPTTAARLLTRSSNANTEPLLRALIAGTQGGLEER